MNKDGRKIIDEVCTEIEKIKADWEALQTTAEQLKERIEEAQMNLGQVHDEDLDNVVTRASDAKGAAMRPTDSKKMEDAERAGQEIAYWIAMMHKNPMLDQGLEAHVAMVLASVGTAMGTTPEFEAMLRHAGFCLKRLPYGVNVDAVMLINSDDETMKHWTGPYTLDGVAWGAMVDGKEIKADFNSRGAALTAIDVEIRRLKDQADR